MRPFARSPTAPRAQAGRALARRRLLGGALPQDTEHRGFGRTSRLARDICITEAARFAAAPLAAPGPDQSLRQILPPHRALFFATMGGSARSPCSEARSGGTTNVPTRPNGGDDRRTGEAQTRTLPSKPPTTSAIHAVPSDVPTTRIKLEQPDAGAVARGSRRRTPDRTRRVG